MGRTFCSNSVADNLRFCWALHVQFLETLTVGMKDPEIPCLFFESNISHSRPLNDCKCHWRYNKSMHTARNALNCLNSMYNMSTHQNDITAALRRQYEIILNLSVLKGDVAFMRRNFLYF